MSSLSEHTFDPAGSVAGTSVGAFAAFMAVDDDSVLSRSDYCDGGISVWAALSDSPAHDVPIIDSDDYALLTLLGTNIHQAVLVNDVDLGAVRAAVTSICGARPSCLRAAAYVLDGVDASTSRYACVGAKPPTVIE
eukprot:5047834-Amphidinium_carterae.1